MVGGPYLLGRLQPEVIVALARANAAQGKPIFRIWPDFEVKALLDRRSRRSRPMPPTPPTRRSARTSAGPCWTPASTHDIPTSRSSTTSNSSGLPHRDFTTRQGDAARDANGHGTHVAGIIAGRGKGDRGHPLSAVRMQRDEDGEVCGELTPLACDLGHRAAVLDRQLQGARRQRRRRDRRHPHRTRRHPADQRPRPALAHPRHQPQPRLRLQPRVVRVRAEPAVRRGRPDGAQRRRRRRRRGQQRLRLCDRRSERCRPVRRGEP